MAKTEACISFAVGHMAFGYLPSKTSSKLLKTKLNIPLALTLSIIPDADIFLQRIPFIQHRGATHSIISALIVFVPFFIIYRKQAAPYFIALVQHGLVGDYIAGGRVQLLWPITNMGFGTSLDIRSLTNQSLEWTMFLAAIFVMLKMKDYKTFFKPQVSNLTLIIPSLTVLLPTLLNTPMTVPALLIPPHIFYLVMFATAILIEAYALARLLPSLITKNPCKNVNNRENRKSRCLGLWGWPLS